MTGCSPITPFTQVKKTPKIHTQNFCCDQDVKRYLDKKSPWIVYSQCDGNPSYYNPGGKVILKKSAYMDAFLVIGKKGDFLRLIKYNPNIIENNTLKNRKQIDYCGWMHQDKLLLSSHALTDISSGRTHKMIAMIRNEKSLTQTQNFFEKDSVILYKEPELLTPFKKISLHSITYLYKKNEDRSKSLVFTKSQIAPDNPLQTISGWIPSSLLTPYGTSFYSKLSEISLEKITLLNKSKEAVEQTTSTFDFEANDAFTELQPITALKQEGEILNVNAHIPIPVIDNNPNYVYGLSGKPIYYKQLKKLKTDLKSINIIFAFENQQSVINNFEQLVVAVNQLKNQLPNKKEFTYKIGGVIGFATQYNTLLEVPLSKNIDAALKTLEQLADHKNDITPSKALPWEATLKAAQTLINHKDETNLIVSIGENGNHQEQIYTYLIENIIKSNARVLGYQLYADNGNIFNNFVLQIQDIITRSVPEILKNKKDILVNSSQLRAENRFIERSENIYSLDFPKQSMWQGWIVFPKKKEQTSQDVLISSVISLLEEMQTNTHNILEQLQESFVASGMSRSKINPLWANLQMLSPEYTPDITFAKPLGGTEPYTLFPAHIQVKKTQWEKGSHFLLLSEDEVAIIQDFFTDITKYQPDYKYEGKKNQQTQKKSFLDDDGTSVKEQNAKEPTYRNTRKVRKHLQKIYCKWVKTNKLYPPKRRHLQKLTLAQATQEAIWYTSNTSGLQTLKIRDMRNKKKLSDKELDKLIEYFIDRKKTFSQAIKPENQLNANNEIFYKINIENLL